MSDILQKAIDVLKSNDRGTYTVPSKKLYPHQWAWDSAFAAIGWSYIDIERALLELETLFSEQWEDGRIPHIRFDPNTSGYFPGPADWKNEKTSTITQPPVAAIALQKIFERGGLKNRILNLIPKIEASHRFFYEQRDPLGIGCIAVAHPWESGLDNSPAWDLPMKNINPELSPSFQRTDNKIIKDSSQRPSDNEYKKYMVLVSEIAESHFGMGSFAVYDPLFSAILIKAEMCLASLCKKLDMSSEAQSRADEMRESLIDHLWDDEFNRFCFLDGSTGEKYAPDILAGYMPLIAGLPESIKSQMISIIEKRYWTEFPLATVSPNSAEYDQRCYWRGPAWINMNWLLTPFLGNKFISSTIEMVKKSGFYEYYDPETGEGLGAEDFTWTAALVIDMLYNQGKRGLF